MKTIHPAFLPNKCFSKHNIEEPIQGIILHYFSAINVDKERKYDFATNWNLFVELNIPEMRGVLISETKTKRSYASAHVLMNRSGDCYQLVPYDKQSYHAGVSEWKGYRNVNSCTYGVEIMGAKGEAYEEVQYEELAKLCITLWEQCGKTFPLTRAGITGHENVATPAGRKVDPGAMFDWSKLFKMINNIVNNT